MPITDFPTAEASRLYLVDLTERVVKTFLQAFLGALALSGPLSVDILTDFSLLQKAAGAGVVAAIALLFGIVGKYVGSPTTAAWLPVSEDTPRA